MLHPPYTAMVLSFAVLGAVISPKFSWIVLGGTLAAYVAGLGVGAHFLDQLPGMGSRYVRHWPNWALWTFGLTGVGTGVVIGIAGSILLRDPLLLVFVAVQGLCALGYPLAPLFGGVFHRDSVFAISWGSLPCLTSYYAQAGTLSVASLLLGATFALLAVVEIRVSRSSRERRQIPVRGDGSAGESAATAARGFRRPDTILAVLSVGTTLVAIAFLAGRFLLVG
jgi:hypothetical protein